MPVFGSDLYQDVEEREKLILVNYFIRQTLSLNYRFPAIEVNSADILVPIRVTDVMIATAISEAISPYSRAVTPRRSLRRAVIREKVCLIDFTIRSLRLNYAKRYKSFGVLIKIHNKLNINLSDGLLIQYKMVMKCTSRQIS